MTTRTTLISGIATALAAIDGTGSYTTTLTVVMEGAPATNDPGAWPFATIRPLRERYDLPGPSPYLDRVLEVEIEAWARRAGPGGTAALTAADNLLADLERAIAADHTLGGAAIDASMVENEVFAAPDDDNAVAVLLRLAVRYRVNRTNPNA